jgi:hypothetical protein
MQQHLNLIYLPSDVLLYLCAFVNSKDLAFVEGTHRNLQEISRSLESRVQLPDGSYRTVKRVQTRSSGIIVCPRLNTRPERPRDYINHREFQ